MANLNKKNKKQKKKKKNGIVFRASLRIERI